MRVNVVRFLNYEGGERDVEQSLVKLYIENYADISEKIKYEEVKLEVVYHSCIFVKDPTTSTPVLLTEQNFISVGENDTLYAYFEIQQKITKKKAFLVRSVTYDNRPTYTEPDIVIHHSNYADLLKTLEFRGSAPDSTFFVDKTSGLAVVLEMKDYEKILSGDDIFTNFHFHGSAECGSRFEELSSIDTRLAGIHINL